MGVHRCRGFWSPFVDRGELANSVLTDVENSFSGMARKMAMCIEVFSEPEKQLPKGNGLRECVRKEKNVKRKQISPQNSAVWTGATAWLVPTLNFCLPGVKLLVSSVTHGSNKDVFSTYNEISHSFKVYPGTLQILTEGIQRNPVPVPVFGDV